VTTRTRRTLLIVTSIVAVLVAFSFSSSGGQQPQGSESLDSVLALVESGRATEARVLQASTTLEVTLSNGETHRARYEQAYAGELTARLLESDATVVVDRETNTLRRRWFVGALAWVVALALIGGGVFFLLLRRRGASVTRPQRGSDTTFADVRGVDAAVSELNEIVQYLRDPRRFTAAGARPPRGVLLHGPPGTGKTLMARAVAGEADVPFYALSGSNFVEMYVGVGASRVRAAFKAAKRSAPSIVFIDEIDAVGRTRGVTTGSGQDEREATLNQLLIEMDGFTNDASVAVIAATNRADVLDPALLRPGRFDRHVEVTAPDLTGRLAILERSTESLALDVGVELADVARRTPGFTGAALSNLVNEAAIRATRRDETVVTAGDLADALDRIVAGPQNGGGLLSDEERELVAHHEAGHALAAAVLGDSELHSVSIIRRGSSLGRTSLVPREEDALATQIQLEERLAVLMAGRAAELAVFGTATTSAESDIASATGLAREMVVRFGMGTRTGPRQIDGQSDASAASVDADVAELIGAAQESASLLMHRHWEVLRQLATELVRSETLNATDLRRILGGLVVDWNEMEAEPIEEISADM